MAYQRRNGIHQGGVYFHVRGDRHDDIDRSGYRAKEKDAAQYVEKFLHRISNLIIKIIRLLSEASRAPAPPWYREGHTQRSSSHSRLFLSGGTRPS